MWRLGSGRLCIEGTLIRKTGANRGLLTFEGGGDLLCVLERFFVILRPLHPQTRFELTIQKLIGFSSGEYEGRKMSSISSL